MISIYPSFEWEMNYSCTIYSTIVHLLATFNQIISFSWSRPRSIQDPGVHHKKLHSSLLHSYTVIDWKIQYCAKQARNREMAVANMEIDLAVKGASWSSLWRLSTLVIDEFLCIVTCCALGAYVRHWMFEKKVNMVQGQQDGPLITVSQWNPEGTEGKSQGQNSCVL